MSEERMKEAGRKSVEAAMAFQQGTGTRRETFSALAKYNDASVDWQSEQVGPPDAIQASVDYLRRLAQRHRAIAENVISRGR